MTNPTAEHPLRVIFLCTGNSCRSQIAEGLARELGGGVVDSHSAGTHPKGLHPLAVRVMREVGIDISSQRSKSVDEYRGQAFDYVITVCDRAKESCPTWPGAREQIHWSFDDPAEAAGSEAAQLVVFRRVLGEIKQRVDRFLLSNLRGTAPK